MVVELDPELKRSLYAELAQEGLTFKDWLKGEVERYLSERRQPLLFAAEPPSPTYNLRRKQ
jgi:hypothetical protein